MSPACLPWLRAISAQERPRVLQEELIQDRESQWPGSHDTQELALPLCGCTSQKGCACLEFSSRLSSPLSLSMETVLGSPIFCLLLHI